MCTGLGKSVLFVSFVQASRSPPLHHHWKGTIFHRVSRNKNGTKYKDPKVSHKATQEGLGDLEGQESRLSGPEHGALQKWVQSLQRSLGPEKSRLLKTAVADKTGPFVFPCLVT